MGYLNITILLFVSSTVLANGSPSPGMLAVPKLSLDYWNQSDRVQLNNCYNYSTNQRTDSFAQPGEASGNWDLPMLCEDVARAAEMDLGITPANYFSFVDKQSETLIALVVAPWYDYHWYRRDDNQLWSHKPGITPATQLDSLGEIILNPEDASRGLYSDFCGYYIVRNYPDSNHEQDAGYVRIGNMKSLPTGSEPEDSTARRVPEPAVSSISKVQFSGRRNPKIPLRTLLDALKSSKNVQAWKGLRTVSDAFEKKLKGDGRLPDVLSGNVGIAFRDEEGLVFPAGSHVEIFEETTRLTDPQGAVSFIETPPSVLSLFSLSKNLF